MRRKILSLILALFLTGDALAAALGDLMVAPTRLVFENGARTQTVSLVNRGARAATYRISLKHMRMKEDGTYEDVGEPEAGEKFADDLLQFSPRQVTLRPGDVQKVRVMARRPEGLAAGEYRSHLLFLELPPPSSGNDVEAMAGGGKITVKLEPVFGVSIPVIVRQGSAMAQALISGVTLQGKESAAPQLRFRVARSGEASLHGDLSVTWHENAGAAGKELAGLQGVSLFHPYPARVFDLPLKIPSGAPLRGGHLIVAYRDADGGAVLAQAKYDLD